MAIKNKIRTYFVPQTAYQMQSLEITFKNAKTRSFLAERQGI